MEITIRRSQPEDYKAIFEIMKAKSVYRNTLQLPYPSIELWKKRLQTENTNHYGFVALKGDEIVGEISLTLSRAIRRRHVAGLGMAIKEELHGQGIGSLLMEVAIDFAENWLNVMRLELEVYSDNEAGVALYKKYGFKIEGKMEKYAFADGEYLDAYVMARLR